MVWSWVIRVWTGEIAGGAAVVVSAALDDAVGGVVVGVGVALTLGAEVFALLLVALVVLVTLATLEEEVVVLEGIMKRKGCR